MGGAIWPYPISCNRDVLDKWETFTVQYVDVGNCKIALKGGNGGKYCSDNGSDGVKCDRDTLDLWEQFTVETLTVPPSMTTTTTTMTTTTTSTTTTTTTTTFSGGEELLVVGPVVPLKDSTTT